ncbi:hypothetical protein ON010_g4651 [Phytophthora cinnamomi]|nr:hypothetical protein ON010_g4651 [Phytophthora cinnamomi]
MSTEGNPTTTTTTHTHTHTHAPMVVVGPAAARTSNTPVPPATSKEKVNLKLITVEPFNEEVPDGHADAGA